MASLSTHVLDTARGRPAAGVIIDLHVLENDAREHLKTLVTNQDGRPVEPFSGGGLASGIYELTFHAADYFRNSGVSLPTPPFIGDVVVRFGIADPSANYHVPLLISPYGYCTYQGS